MEAENEELRAKLELYDKKEREGAQEKQGLPSRRESGMEEEWRMEVDVENEIESHKKLDEQKKEVAEGVQTQECPAAAIARGGATKHQKAKKRSQTYTKHPGQKKKFAEIQYPQQKKICGSSKRSSCKKRSVSFSLSDRVDKNKMADAEMAAELQRLWAGEEKKRQQCFANR